MRGLGAIVGLGLALASAVEGEVESSVAVALELCLDREAALQELLASKDVCPSPRPSHPLLSPLLARSLLYHPCSSI